jgi:hypothetical protein
LVATSLLNSYVANSALAKVITFIVYQIDKLCTRANQTLQMIESFSVMQLHTLLEAY